LRKIIFVGIVAAALGVGFYLLKRHHRVSPSLRVTSAEHPFAPEFSLPDMSGQQLKLSDYRGKVVLLDFWATWCDPCRDEIPHFVELQNKVGDQGFQIIGVSMDDGPEPVRDFYRKFKMNYPVVMGNAQIGELYGGVLGLPIAFMIGRDGRIYSKHIGATEVSLLEREIEAQLHAQRPSSVNWRAPTLIPFSLPSPTRNGTSRLFATSLP
jgi:cytochrome c biogenesis protein CcmG, thiol:disulfide interchange protein DsbE